jgi:hypothetical protein
MPVVMLAGSPFAASINAVRNKARVSGCNLLSLAHLPPVQGLLGQLADKEMLTVDHHIVILVVLQPQFPGGAHY